MAWLVGRKPTPPTEVGDLIERTAGTAWTLAKLQASIVANFGGAVSDYCFYELADSEFAKITDGWAYDLTWANGEITGVSFTNETNKPWVKLSSSKSSIANDGVDSCTITLEVWKPNLSGIATAVQRSNFRVTITTPDGDRFVRINIVNGVGVATFKTTKAGPYTFPADSKRYGTMRIFNQLKVDVDDLTLLTQ